MPMETVHYEQTVYQVRKSCEYRRGDVLVANTGNECLVRKALLNVGGQYIMYEVEWGHSGEVVLLSSDETEDYEKDREVEEMSDF